MTKRGRKILATSILVAYGVALAVFGIIASGADAGKVATVAAETVGILVVTGAFVWSMEVLLAPDETPPAGGPGPAQ